MYVEDINLINKSGFVHHVCNSKMCIYSNLPIARRGHVFLGNRCNYKCIFCYNKTLQHEDFYSKEQIKKYINYICEYGIKDLEFTGGEPTLNSDLKEFISYGKSKGCKNIAFITNGFNNKDYREYYNSGCNEILFSIHGYDENSNYLITGIKDSWNRLLRSIECALKIGFKIRVNITINKFNYKHLYEHSKLINSIFGDKLFAINYLPMNSWDNSIINEDPSVPFYEYSDELAESIENIDSSVKKAIRYIPYCVVDYSIYKYIYNQLQHIYDPYDWNRELDGKHIRPELLNMPYGYSSIDSVFNTRIALYTKFEKCLYCKFRYICDGFQTNSLKREQLYLNENKYIPSLNPDNIFVVRNINEFIEFG